jgi:hypothetical protein
MAEGDHERLELPARLSIEDAGAHDLGRYFPAPMEVLIIDRANSNLESSDSDDHFSDAHSGLDSAPNSPVVPLTRVEKVDSEPSYGEVPGTDGYKMRQSDAEPDIIAPVLVQDKGEYDSPSIHSSGSPIPRTLVENVDPSSPSHGDIPGTHAHDMRASDAVPDLILKPGHISPSSSSRSRSGSPGDQPMPTTKVEKVDSGPNHGEVPGTEAFELRKSDAEPDIVANFGHEIGKTFCYL